MPNFPHIARIDVVDDCLVHVLDVHAGHADGEHSCQLGEQPVLLALVVQHFHLSATKNRKFPLFFLNLIFEIEF